MSVVFFIIKYCDTDRVRCTLDGDFKVRNFLKQEDKLFVVHNARKKLNEMKKEGRPEKDIEEFLLSLPVKSCN